MLIIRTSLFLLMLLLYNTALCVIDNAIIKKIQANLNSQGKTVIEFEQLDRNGKKAFGALLLEKPYFFRCNYYPPYPLLIVGGKKYISLYDYDMETLSRIEAGQNILSLLLQDDWSNNKSFKLLATRQDKHSFIISVLLLHSQEQVEISFDKTSLNLAKIDIFELGDLSISIKFAQTQQIKSFKPGLFEIRSPEVFGKPQRLDAEKLRYKYVRD